MWEKGYDISYDIRDKNNLSNNRKKINWMKKIIAWVVRNIF